MEEVKKPTNVILNILACHLFQIRVLFLARLKKLQEDKDKFIRDGSDLLQRWVVTRYLHIAVFNTLLLLLILLRSAGYFEPIYLISINFIVMAAILMSVFLLGAQSRTVFAIAILFLLLAVPFRLFGSLHVWSERTVMYAFESVVIAIALFVTENIDKR